MEPRVFATLKRMLGIGSETIPPTTGRVTSTSTEGVRTAESSYEKTRKRKLSRKKNKQFENKLYTPMAKRVVMR